MASRVMPLRALAGFGVLAASLGLGLLSPVAASAPAAPVSAPAPVVRSSTTPAVAATATTADTLGHPGRREGSQRAHWRTCTAFRAGTARRSA